SSTAPPPPALYTLSLHDALPILAPKSEATALSRSSSELGRVAAATPSATPMVVDSTSAVAVSNSVARKRVRTSPSTARFIHNERSEEHTSELQSRFDLVCRLLLE